MKNIAAIEKLAEIIYDKVDSAPRNLYLLNVEPAIESILTAIQADPMAYGIKPKPLSWRHIGGEHIEECAISICGRYEISENHGLILFTVGEETYRPTLRLELGFHKDLKAAAYTDLCNRVKEIY